LLRSNAGKKISGCEVNTDITIANIATTAPKRYLKYPVIGEVIGSGSITSANNKTVGSITVLAAISNDEVARGRQNRLLKNLKAEKAFLASREFLS